MIESVSEIVRQGRGNRGRRPNAETAPAPDRLPPHSIEAERGVLGCCLRDPGQCLNELLLKCGRLAPQQFYDLSHQTIAGVMLKMHDEQIPVDLITVQERLRKIEMLEQVGGIAYLSELEDGVPSAANLPYYLEIVQEKAKLRRLIQICSGIVGKVFDYEGPVEKLMVECEAEISKLTEEETQHTETHIREVMQQVITDMEQWHYTRGSQQLRGLPTGPKGNYLDKVLTGIRETHYVVIAARPGEGKSAKALNIVEYLAEHHEWYEPTGKQVPSAEDPAVLVPETIKRKGIPVGVFTIEMDNESLGYRLIFGRAGVSEAKFNQGFAEKGAEERLVRAASDLSRMNIYLDDTPAQTIGQIAAKARRMVKQYGIKLFVLDYLQLAQGDDPRDEKRVQVDKISKKIMALKKQLKVPWIVLAQLNRNIETAERDRNPVLSDLAESGSIEQDADKVIILKRTSRRALTEEKEGPDGVVTDEDQMNRIVAQNEWDWSLRPRRVDLWVVKNRRGPTGKAEEVFQGNLCRFTDWHLFKVQHGIEARKEGESKHLGEAPAATDELR